MHQIEQALRDVQYLARRVEKEAPRTGDALRILYQMAASKTEDVMIRAPVAMDPAFIDAFRHWNPEQRSAGTQLLTTEQILALRHFAVGSICRLEYAGCEAMLTAYTETLCECDKALSLLAR